MDDKCITHLDRDKLWFQNNKFSRINNPIIECAKNNCDHPKLIKSIKYSSC